MKKAVVLVSGGLDSTTCLVLAKSRGFECFGLSFNYEQRHEVELVACKKIMAFYGVAHKVLRVPLNEIGGSALTDKDLQVPDFAHSEQIPITYVPARNTIFLSFALAYAEVIGAHHIFIGANAVDYSNYPDCRPEYLSAFQTMANLATKASVEGKGVVIEAPLLTLSKADIVKLGTELGIDYSMTVSCYQPNEKGEACGRCDSCTFRKKGFQEAQLSDPTLYF